MSLLDRVKTLPSICGVELAFTGELLPSAIEGYQQFANSIPAGTDFTSVYADKASVDFNEESDSKGAGTYYKQKISIRFPASDRFRSDRIALMHKLKFVKIKFSNDNHIVLGRNDFEQNSKPRIKTKTDERLGQLEVESTSIFPSGYVPPVPGSFPTLFPIDFINEE